MSDDTDEFEYPPSWTPPGAQPPIRRSYKPALRSGLGVTGDEHTERHDAYPESCQRPTKVTLTNAHGHLVSRSQETSRPLKR
jgi:hypothetical protein